MWVELDSSELGSGSRARNDLQTLSVLWTPSTFGLDQGFHSECTNVPGASTRS